MSLENAFQDYQNCELPENGTPGEDEACRTCPLNKPVHEYEEHPTFCEYLQEIEVQYSSYPKSGHSMAPY